MMKKVFGRRMMREVMESTPAGDSSVFEIAYGVPTMVRWDK
jgi:hypothetical protein